ncbi:MAG: gamma-glutamyl-gamma-aminobutyrate hydrolase family protein [Acidimicrobiales bacterium]
MPPRPLVLVTGRRLAAARTPWRIEYASPRTYADAIARSGGRPLVVPVVGESAITPAEWLEGVDGLVLTGGPDVDPRRYGQDPHPRVYGVEPDADTLEAGLLEAAQDRGIAVLAICRGIQVLNVAFGGTLHQHISDRSDLGDHGTPGDLRAADHEVRLDPGSRVAAALGVETAMVCSIHHQAIDRVGDGLVVTATSADGLVEAVELDDDAAGWVVGVQWHPEWSDGTDEIQERLFVAFVAEAARSAAAPRSAGDW